MLDYLWAVFGSWWGLALGLLGANELSQVLFRRSWKKLHDYRWPVAFVLLLVSQGIVYRDLAMQPTSTNQTTQAPSVIAENPDHAGLVDRLENANDKLRIAEKGRDDERTGRLTAEQRVAALERQLDVTAQRQTQCERLATLSKTGRELVGKLRATRAALETKREIDDWYSAVVAAMSKPQGEAFLAAPPASGLWAAYPSNDGGYSQTLRGRSEYLSRQLSTLCR